jgi:hypothetical protein
MVLFITTGVRTSNPTYSGTVTSVTEEPAASTFSLEDPEDGDSKFLRNISNIKIDAAESFGT